MRIGITVLTDTKGALYVYPGAGDKALPLADMELHKALVKTAATKGLKIGGREFAGGMVFSQHGTESRKRFPTEASRARIELEAKAAKAKADAETKAAKAAAGK